MSGCPFATRRAVLGAAAGLAGAIGAAHASTPDASTPDASTTDASTTDASTTGAPPPTRTAAPARERLLPFHGAHQNGIATPMQGHTYFAAFDVATDRVADLASLMRAWTDAAARLAQGLSLGGTPPDQPQPDSGEVLGLPPSRLTLTSGFGPGLFARDGEDRFGLARHRPAAFVDLPRFAGDQLVPERTGGDLSVQACGDDPQATMHAVRQLMRLASGVATVRWVQTGFLAGHDPDRTPRNLMGFRDGSQNVAAGEPDALDRFVWVGEEGGSWMRGGSYAVVRPIRVALEHWDRMRLAFQEQTIGRHKASGAPIGGRDEFEPADFDASDGDGNPLIAEAAHTRLAAPAGNDGARILRRGHSYDNGVGMVAERWPPWRHMVELDAGLLFICYQRDPAPGFVKIFDRMPRFDMLNQFVTHTGGGLFACPGGIARGGYLAQGLFEQSQS